MPVRIYPTITAQVEVDIKAGFDLIRNAIAPFQTNLTNEEKRTFPKEGQAGEAFVERATQAAHNHSVSIPADCDVADLDNYNMVKKIFRESLAYGDDVIQSMIDTEMLAGILAMGMSSRIYGFLKLGDKGNVPLQNTVKDLGVFFDSRGNRIAPTLTTIPPSGTTTIDGLKPVSRVINKGETIIKIKCSSELSVKVQRFADITLNPGESFKLPPKHTSVIVINSSTTIGASIMITLK